MCAAIYGDSGKRINSLVYSRGDGYSYHRNRTNEFYPGHSTVYLRCTNYYSKSCTGTASIRQTPGQQTWRNGNDHVHTCIPNPLDRQARLLRNEVLEACRTSRYERPRYLFNRIAIRHPPHVAAMLQPHRIGHAMRRARWSQYPNVPRSIPELGALLSNPQYSHLTSTHDGTDNIYSGMVGQSGSRSLVFVSRRMLTFLEEITMVFGDATFSSCPAQPVARQLYQIVTVVRDTVVPIVTALMESKSFEAYEAILLHLRQMAPRFRPRVAMTDFELPEQNAWQTVYRCKVLGCYVHFIRACLRKIGQLGLRILLTDDELCKKVVDALLAIPLLPKALMNKGFVVMVQYAQRCGVFQELLPFLSYFVTTWLSGPASSTLSIFMEPHRTNNPCECAHKVFRQDTGPYHPNLWVFLDALKTYEFGSITDAIAFTRGYRMGVGRRLSAIHNDRAILNFSKDLLQGTISIRRFLFRASRRVTNLINEYQ